MVFIDTNILIYAYDERDKSKRHTATLLLKQIFEKNNGAISSQVIQEFCNVAISKIKTTSLLELEDTISVILTPLLQHTPNPAFYKRTLKLHANYSLSFYDALIIQAALDIGCTTLYSEDLQHQQVFGPLTVINPFI